MEIDDSLYSRQRYVLGDSAMKRMAKSSVLICGMGGLGIEIAKNVVLAGVKSLSIQDPTVSTIEDLGTQFFLREEDVTGGKTRAMACCPRLAELNPYVTVSTMDEPLTDSSDLSYLSQFQCVILTEVPLSLQIKINNYCRSQSPPIAFITTDVYGVFSWSFCDFGDTFEVFDNNGEEPKEMFISGISKCKQGIVSTLENRMHGLEDGDSVTFKEVQGMSAINGKTFSIKVISPYSFGVGDLTSEDYGPYVSGGIITQVKVPKQVVFESLSKQLVKPAVMTPDLLKFEAPIQIHVGMMALHEFRDKFSRLPQSWHAADASELVKIAEGLKENGSVMVDNIDKAVIEKLSYTSAGQLAPLCAAIGGIIAQEALKAVTGKFTPLMQWLHLDATEVIGNVDDRLKATSMSTTRYSPLQVCIGEDLLKKLNDLRLFMVGCGAIGCEMLKNYALLGVGCGDQGCITITDNDLIEKSNLNRQFLFRPHHIRKPKSTTAACAAQEINPALQIEAHQHKVCPQTESTAYTDHFFERQDLVVNALDNVEARRYIDSRCVTTGRPLLESGTMGAKGHVQVIVPHLTESYSNQRDPVDEDVPYCTLKSFPAVIEHCIQWARDKFESSFVQKPSAFNKFWSGISGADVAQQLADGQRREGVVQVSKITVARPTTWPECAIIGRLKFEKYFSHKGKHLLHAFPLDTKLKDGSPFWQLPKRPPTPLVFEPTDAAHMAFVIATARLYAHCSGVTYTKDDLDPAQMCSHWASVKIPQFRPTSKRIETDEAAAKPEEKEEDCGDELEKSIESLKKIVSSEDGQRRLTHMAAVEFEKDDDSNGHIDFITAASNLRAAMYGIEAAERLKTKRIAGRIVPAIATTTAAVAGLVSIELLKVIAKSSLEDYKNCFLNLALPLLLHSEPGPSPVTKLSNGLCYTGWDRWEIHGRKDMTLQQLLTTIKDKHGVDVGMVVHGVKMVYVPMMPAHKKRLPQPLTKLIKPHPGCPEYVDLVVSFQGPEEDEMGPPLRYFFGE